MQKIAHNTFIINKKGKYCPYCGKYTIRVNTTCPHCSPAEPCPANWPRRGKRCHNCEAAIDPEWSYCEICGVETARAKRLKRAKMLSHRAKLQKVAHSQLPPPPSPCPKSPDLYGPDHDIEELDSIESTLNCGSDQQSGKTPATESTNASHDIEIDVVADGRDSSCLL